MDGTCGEDVDRISERRFYSGCSSELILFIFFFNDASTTEIYTLSLPGALPIFQISRFNRGENVDLTGTFWFGLPRDLSSTDVARLKACGAYVFPAINTFRYPKEGHRELARKDIKRLVSDGVDGFQIDSIYSDLVTR